MNGEVVPAWDPEVFGAVLIGAGMFFAVVYDPTRRYVQKRRYEAKERRGDARLSRQRAWRRR